MPEIILPNKDQVDAIKTDTESILTNFPISAGGIDWREYDPITYFNSILPAQNTWTDVIDLSGEGYLSLCSFYNASGVATMRITIDGVIKLILSNADANSGFGFTRIDLLDNSTAPRSGILSPRDKDSLDYLTYFVINKMRTYPVVVEASGTVANADNIYFNTSLKVEIYHTNAVEGNRTTAYLIQGGIK